MNEHKFESLDISAEILRGISDEGYAQMTGIQEKVIPIILQGLDVIGQSSTGTGKTAAFGIPAIQMLENDGSPDPQVLVLCPTRELAMQVSDELRKFSKYKEGARIVTIYGGQNIETQIRALKRSSIVVGTPGRIIDHLRRRTLRLGNIKMAVLDEADEMLDMGFLGDIKQILHNTPVERQTLLFSATMPTEIIRITQQFQKSPQHIKGDDGQTAFGLIEQYFVEIPQSKKIQATRMLFEQYGAKRSLIFCNTKLMVDRLARNLSDMGLSAMALHGDMRQSSRTKVMSDFKNGSVNMLVATDVAARGIDASGIDMIINYDIPQDIEYYVHRIGRTGRAGNDGVAFTLVASSGEFFGLRDIEDATGQTLKPYYLQGLEATPDDVVYSRSTGRSGGQGRPSKPQSGERRGQNAVISVDVGREHDVTEQHIIDSVIKYARLKKDDIGSITLKDNESHIEVSPEVARHIMKSMRDATVNDFLVVFKVVRDGSGGGKPGAPRGGRQGRGGSGSRYGKKSGGK